MKRLFTCFILIAIFALALAGCGRSQSENLPTRGAWHGHTYVSEYFGLQFTLPESWVMFTDTERAIITGTPPVSWDIFEDIEAEIEVHDMRAADFITGDDVLIRIQAFAPDLAEDMDYVGYLQSMSSMLQFMGIGARNFQMGAVPRQIGEYQWHYMTYLIFDDALQMILVNIQGRFVRTIVATAQNGSASNLDNILNNFSAIDSAFAGETGTPFPGTSTPGTAAFGTWDGNVYTNPSINLTFNMPEWYRAYTTLELANDMEIPIRMMETGTIGTELWEEAFFIGGDIDVMFAYDETTYSSVGLSVRRMPNGMRTFPLHGYLERHINQEAQMWASIGFDIEMEFAQTTTRIGAHEWYSGRVIVSFESLTFMAERFVTIVDGYVWSLVVVADNVEELGKILGMF